MNHGKTLVFIFLFACWALKAPAQSLERFDDVLRTQKIGRKLTRKVGNDISERSFLGYIKDSTGRTRYYVVIEFLRIKAANVYHGHSSILFFNTKQNLVQRAILTMPYELPFRLKNNILYFKYSEKGIVKIFAQKVGPLPKMICVGNGCYDVSPP